MPKEQDAAIQFLLDWLNQNYCLTTKEVLAACDRLESFPLLDGVDRLSVSYVAYTCRERVTC